jgi:thiol-disulfide isomerase/thioredoxin
MKKQTVLSLTLFIFLFTSCTKDYTSTDYLEKVLVNLETIESATYKLTGEHWYPGDTAALGINYSFVKEYDNPADTTIGSKFLLLDNTDTSILSFCYDGQMRALVYNDEKRIVLDSFTVNPRPFRPLTPPFFNYAESIIRYALETNDSAILNIEDLKDRVYMKITVFEDNQIEFFGKPYRVPISPYSFDNTSIYEIWINKINNLPYKVRREMSHNISVTTCEDIELNKIDIKDFKASDYFPDDYKIQTYRLGGKRTKKSELIGKQAPGWTLATEDKSPFSLTDMESKVTMIQFTSVSCGPCKASIPFLKELSVTYNKEDFDFVAIECSSRNTNVLKSYMQRNDFDYKFLLSTKEVLKSYSISSFPIFFILDENQKIREVIYGYGKGTTDEKIRSIINEMIDKSAITDLIGMSSQMTYVK